MLSDYEGFDQLPKRVQDAFNVIADYVNKNEGAWDSLKYVIHDKAAEIVDDFDAEEIADSVCDALFGKED